MQICNRINEESKWLINGRREKEEQEYHHKKKAAHKIIRNSKKTYMKNVTESIEEDQNHNNTRKMYQTINQIKKGLRNLKLTARLTTLGICIGASMTLRRGISLDAI